LQREGSVWTGGAHHLLVCAVVEQSAMRAGVGFVALARSFLPDHSLMLVSVQKLASGTSDRFPAAGNESVVPHPKHHAGQ
jgi:hypothetical protein